MENELNSNNELNGVPLPENVVRELKRLGRALESFTAGELHSAVRACEMDGNLIDDPNGMSFLDQLELTAAEKQKALHNNENIMDEDDEEETSLTNCKSNHHSNKISSFCKRLTESRMRRMHENMEAYATYN